LLGAVFYSPDFSCHSKLSRKNTFTHEKSGLQSMHPRRFMFNPIQQNARFVRGLCLAALFVAFCVAVAEPIPDRWLVITAPAFHADLQPLIEHRMAEGFEVTTLVTTNLLTPDDIRNTNAIPLQAYIRDSAERTNSACHVLLVGLPASPDPTNAQQTVVPALLGSVGRMNGRLTDYPFAPIGGSGAPRTAIGRFPARTTDEARAMVNKTLRLETQPIATNALNRLVLLMGNPGGGPVAEIVVETTLQQRLQRLHPTWIVHAISCSSGSRHHVPPEQARDTFFRSLEEGGLFTVFMGHSSAASLWLGAEHHLTRRDLIRVNMPGIFFTCGCYALQFHPGNAGYGVAAMRQPNGPAAVIGATAESYAAPGLLAADGLLQCLREPPFPHRLADYWLAIQTGLATGEIDTFTFNLYDQADGTKGKVPLDVQRREHLEMWMLLGDPALRIPVPQELVP
jgi:hypothetical protein